jgi:SAM-dependent methyltransferase
MECVLSLAEMPARVLAECGRVLVPGGRLALSDIYARNPLPPDGARLPVHTCLNGAVGEDCLKERVLSAGFAIQSWADHSRLLQQLAGQLIFRYGSQAAFWSRFCSEPPSEAAVQAIKAMRPGYYLLIARKT